MTHELPSRWGFVRARVALFLLAALSVGCQTAASAVGTQRLEVTEIMVVFTEPGAGRLHFAVPKAPAEVTAVRWRLELDGRLFAAGLEGHPSRSVKGLEVEVPLVWRHLGWREGARFLMVRVEGDLIVGAAAAEVSFEGTHEVLVQGSPILESAGDRDPGAGSSPPVAARASASAPTAQEDPSTIDEIAPRGVAAGLRSPAPYRTPLGR